jgi:hypothetical protein
VNNDSGSEDAVIVQSNFSALLVVASSRCSPAIAMNALVNIVDVVAVLVCDIVAADLASVDSITSQPIQSRGRPDFKVPSIRPTAQEKVR